MGKCSFVMLFCYTFDNLDENESAMGSSAVTAVVVPECDRRVVCRIVAH